MRLRDRMRRHDNIGLRPFETVMTDAKIALFS